MASGRAPSEVPDTSFLDTSFLREVSARGVSARGVRHLV